MVIVHLVLQPSLCGIDCRQILEMPRLLKILNNYYLLNHYRVFTDILFGVLLYYILFVQNLSMAPASNGTLLNIHYYYY